MAEIDRSSPKEPLSNRFLRWYNGEAPPVEEPEEYKPPAHDPALLPPETQTRYRYHNKTLAERAAEWAGRSGQRAFANLYNTVAVAACVTIVAVLLATVAFLPGFGEPGNPTDNEVPARYIEQGVQETGAVNVVAGLILDYRAFDTFGEANVLFIAACAVLLLLAGAPPDAFDTLLREMEEPRHDIILKKIATILIPMIMLFGCYVVMGGHLGPGGGFSGGSIIGAALILYASAFGTRQARQFFTITTYGRIVTVCLSFYGLAKGYAFFTGANHIESVIPLGTPGRLFSGGLILPLNIAVGMIVACTMYVFFLLFSKGSDALDDD